MVASGSKWVGWSGWEMICAVTLFGDGRPSMRQMGLRFKPLGSRGLFRADCSWGFSALSKVLFAAFASDGLLFDSGAPLR